MSKQTNDQQVLMAILNVKKYAKNLKKKVSNLQDINEQGNPVSSPSFFQTGPHQYLELNSPLLGTKSSYNQSFESMTRQKKQHSMTFLPGSKKVDRESRKNSDVMLPQPISPSKTFTHSNAKSFLSQSYKMEASGLKSANEAAWKKERKQASQTFINLEKKASTKKQNLSEANLQILNQALTMPVTISKIQESQPQNKKVILSLLLEINSLKAQICDYKKTMIVLRTKYLQMEEKCSQKAQTDHLLDVYQRKIETVESEKEKLNQIIKVQNQKIGNFQTLVVDIFNKFSQHFKQETKRMVKLQAQNQIYKNLLNLKLPNQYPLPLRKQDIVKLPRQSRQEQKNYQSETESQGQEYTKPLQLKIGICKNQKDLQNKYQKVNLEE